MVMYFNGYDYPNVITHFKRFPIYYIIVAPEPTEINNNLVYHVINASKERYEYDDMNWTFIEDHLAICLYFADDSGVR